MMAADLSAPMSPGALVTAANWLQQVVAGNAAMMLGVIAVGIGFTFAGVKQAAVGASANDKFLEFAVTGTANHLKLVTVGYGKTKLKDTANGADPINRRVQVVNMDTKTASK